ncbi:DinB family protein [Leptospira stimsonii]|uniref:Damage-inducible protein DinB n=1 Tax=Leptospira stimsonii TaxID=2202203 RepID=A0A396Z953_9LEPT|nr:DinB family protein [Leptospira stimsonii]RHX91959.1 damage-inducible protein DinB [Leptospira stimsonii]
MISPEHCRLLAEYNRWMNEKVYSTSSKLSDLQRKEDRGAYFKSIHSTLNHILWVDLSWLARFQGKELPKGTAGSDLYSDFGELFRKRKECDEKIIEWASGIESTWLETPFRFFSIVYQRELEKPTWVLVDHIFNHQTHHRGQITTLLSQMGLDVGITDLAWM